MEYLSNHSYQVTSLVVPWARTPDWPLAVSELPPDLQLASLELTGLALGHKDDIDLNDDCGVLRQQSRLAKLRLHDCLWKGGQHGLHVALASLPTLQHLSIDILIMATWDEYGCCTIDPKVLHHLPRLTYLEISRMNIGWDCDPYTPLPGHDPKPLDPLAAVQLTELQALRFSAGPCSGKAKTMQVLGLAGMPQLTYLHLDDRGHHLSGVVPAFTSMTHLQHLRAPVCVAERGYFTGIAMDLSQLQHLTRLTYLCVQLEDSLSFPPPEVSTYSALTASSQLQHLEVWANKPLPSRAWQHMMPAGQHLSHLHTLLDVEHFTQYRPKGSSYRTYKWGCSDVTGLVSTCPGLHHLSVTAACSELQLAPLSRLTGLRELAVRLPPRGCDDREPLAEIMTLALLTTLQGLTLFTSGSLNIVLHLTQLEQLTSLAVQNFLVDDNYRRDVVCDDEVRLQVSNYVQG